MDPLWRTSETAAYIGRPAGTLRQWRHKGIGPRCFKVEGLVMYRKSEVEKWLAAQEAADRLVAGVGVVTAPGPLAAHRCGRCEQRRVLAEHNLCSRCSDELEPAHTGGAS